MSNILVSNFDAMLEKMDAHDTDFNYPLGDGDTGFMVDGDIMAFIFVPSTRDSRPTGCSEVLAMLRNPPPVAFEQPVRKNGDDNFELYGYDEQGNAQVYHCFRESNASAAWRF